MLWMANLSQLLPKNSTTACSANSSQRHATYSATRHQSEKFVEMTQTAYDVYSLDVTDVSVTRTRRPKKKRNDNDEWRSPFESTTTTRRIDRHETLYASWDLAHQIQTILHHMRLALLCNAPDADLVRISRQQLQTDRRKRQRLSASVAELDSRLNVVLTDALSELVDLSKILGSTLADSVGMTALSPFPLSRRPPAGDFDPSRHTVQVKKGSSEDELSVAEALVTMSHLLPDHV